ncbi:hypothetical protein BJY04DRAFT_232680 [Aspergillus karnatakaensis]|uniref:fungal specific transcription factor domain-containing protein n=1 Tax=Aspergillus karnatakaensis TaxID=1810916 RepID=UPI003CCCC3EC
MADRCFYHPAPMTRATTRFRPFRGQQPPLQDDLLDQSSQTGKQKKLDEAEPLPVASPSGYLGSFSALRLLPRFSPVSTTPAHVRNDPMLQLSSVMQTLESLLESARLEQVLSDFFGGARYTIIPRPLIMVPFSSLLREFHQSRNRKAYFEHTSERIQANLNSKLASLSTHVAPVQFYRSFTAENVRLEYIALLFAISGVASHYSQSPAHDAKFAAAMYTASKDCIQICEAFNQVNDLSIWARLMNVLLSSFLFGDASNNLYHRFSEFVAELFIMGFHRLESSPPEVPFSILETRKRIFAFAVTRDKSLATFLGRPPRIGNDFCDRAMPLDLDDDEITLQGSQLQAVLQGSGDGGWRDIIGRGEIIRQSSFLRLRYQQAELQEKVLCLSLGNRGPSFSTKLRELYNTYQAGWDDIPSQYRYQTSSWTAWSPQLCVTLLVIHLQYLYSGFQIERMLLQDGQVPIACLLETSMKLLSGVLDFIQQQHSRPKHYEGYAWLFSYYGLPGAGILATELHQSTISGKPLPTTTPRSQLIRDLSVLLAYFEREKLPDRPDFQVCVQISKVIAAMLDDTLNHYPQPHPQPRHRTRPNQPVGQASSGILDTGQQVNDHIDRSYDNPTNVLSLAEPMTSQDFLSWFDELIWDDPYLNFESGSLG